MNRDVCCPNSQERYPAALTDSLSEGMTTVTMGAAKQRPASLDDLLPPRLGVVLALAWRGQTVPLKRWVVAVSAR